MSLLKKNRLSMDKFDFKTNFVDLFAICNIFRWVLIIGKTYRLYNITYWRLHIFEYEIYEEIQETIAHIRTYVYTYGVLVDILYWYIDKICVYRSLVIYSIDISLALRSVLSSTVSISGNIVRVPHSRSNDTFRTRFGHVIA